MLYEAKTLERRRYDDLRVLTRIRSPLYGVCERWLSALVNP
jgi:hypothetical protein